MAHSAVDLRTSSPRRLPGLDAETLRMFGLSRREIAVLELVARGHTNAQAADKLGISPLTIKKHLERMYGATDARNRTALIAFLSNGSHPTDARRAPAAPKHNLPSALTSFVGREREIDELTALLATARLVTLGGPGGIGKTRLALEVGANPLQKYRDGVWLVELGGLSDPRLVARTVGTALGVRDSGRSRLAALTDVVRSKQLLLILDNCEHLVRACAELVEPLLRACPELRVLATSRESLGVNGEIFWPVPSLSLPGLWLRAGSRVPEAVERSEAVRLFVERASRRRPGFALTAANARAVVEICGRLDGMPLAIELAAAKVNVLSVEEIAARLDDRFHELRTDAPEAPARHRTLRGVIDWSYHLLGPPERMLFERLAVFAGGCDLEAAVRVCVGEGIGPEHVLELLSHLVDRSLVTAEVRGNVTRYKMLETLQSYGRERLDGSASMGQVRARHAAHFCDLAETAEPLLKGPEQRLWFERLDLEHDNLRAALLWAFDHDPEVGLRLAGALWRFWFHRGHSREGARWLDEALTVDARAIPLARAKALNGAARLANALGDRPLATRLDREAVELRRAIDDRHGLTASLSNLADSLREGGDLTAARCLYEESLELKRELGDTWGLAITTSGLGHLAWAEGDIPRAEQAFRAALRLIREVGDLDRAGHLIVFLGHTARAQGRATRAASLYRRGLRIFRQFDDRVGLDDGLTCLAISAAKEGRYEHAARLLGTAAATRDATAARSIYTARAEQEALQSLRAALDPRDLEAALEAGRAMPLDAAVESALSLSD